MDDHNMDGSQNAEDQYSPVPQDNYYQDYTANIPYQNPPPSVEDNKENGFQVASLVLGIFSILSGCCYGIFGLILGIAGLVFAIIGNKSSKNGIGTAGLVCSIIGLIFSVVVLFIIIMIYASLFSMLTVDPGSLYYYDIYDGSSYIMRQLMNYFVA